MATAREPWPFFRARGRRPGRGRPHRRRPASADAAYVHGMGVVLPVCALAALVAAPTAGALLPGRGAGGAGRGVAAPGKHARQ